MPHITVKPFDTSCIDAGKYGQTALLFRANDLHSSDEMLGVSIENETFLLHLKKAKANWLLKYDKVTRPLNVNLVKQAIADIAHHFELEIVNSNIEIHHRKRVSFSPYEKRIEDFVNIVYPFKRMAIEVGFGSGKHLLYQARKNPDCLFIGIEIHTPSAEQVLRQIELQEIENIWVVNYDARLLLEMIPSNLCEKIFVHFPVPWDKKPQRRVISKSFLSESMRVLKVGGRLELRTDSPNYFWYALETFLGEGVKQTAVEIRKNESLEVTSKYEARWLRQEKDIYDVYVTAQEESEPRSIDFDFSLNEIKYHEQLIESIPSRPIVMENFFIHFERIYRIDDETILLKLSFGSFDRPEHKYIRIGKQKSYYFASIPVKTMTNYQTHLKILELLNA